MSNENSGISTGETNFITNTAHFAAYIYATTSDINWVGFYFFSGEDLIVGPYQGKPACIRLAKGKGVCHACIEQRQPIIVPDVHEFSGHIVCDSDSSSELVIPLIYKSKIFGVLDIDSPVVNRFSEKDLNYFKELIDILLDNSDIISIISYYAESR